jgi:hypothetical protein
MSSKQESMFEWEMHEMGVVHRPGYDATALLEALDA